MFPLLRRASELIRKHRNDQVELISHMDADGVCAAALISLALEREHIEHNVRFVRMLYRDVVEQIDPGEFTIFLDLGSSQLPNLEPWKGREVIICDHHPPSDGGWPGLIHLNAHLLGMDGTQEISGAGMAYLLARTLNPENVHLSKLAVLGAIGDLQNAWGKLRGMNRRILEESKQAGEVRACEDLLLFGKYTRPIFKSLVSLSDPYIPGLSNSPAGVVSILQELGIQVRQGTSWRRIADLTQEERQRLAQALIERAKRSVPPELSEYVPSLIWGECYLLTREGQDTPLYDASEFATCLNSTARHEQPRVGFELAKGDRGSYYRTMLHLLSEYRRHLSKAMEHLQSREIKQGKRGIIRYFDLTGVVREVFVGTVASLCISSGLTDPYKPVVGYACEGGVAKVSARCSKLLFLRGLDMARAIRQAAESVGGEGGGHPVACGAQVPEEKVEAFLEAFEENLAAFFRYLPALGKG